MKLMSIILLAALIAGGSQKATALTTSAAPASELSALDAQFQKAIESDLLHSRALLRTLNALDSGDATKARKIAIIPVLFDLDFAQYYFTKGLASPTPEQTRQWTEVAGATLDYMLDHSDELDPRRVDVQGGLRAFRYFLTAPEDVRRIDELSGQLGKHKRKPLDIPRFFVACTIIAGGVLFGLAPFDRKRVRAGWAKLAFGIMAVIWVVVGVGRIAWNLDWFKLGPDTFDRVNNYDCIATGAVIGMIIALALARQFIGAKREL